MQRNCTATRSSQSKDNLLVSEGKENKDIARELGISQQILSKWRRRFFKQGREGLEDKPRLGKPNKADLKTHQVKKWVNSQDTDFEAKMTDIVGLYLNPPENALVLSVDEKPLFKHWKKNIHHTLWSLEKHLTKHKNHIFLHFTPTHASWLNQIELCFSILSRKVLKREIFNSKKNW